MNTKKPAKINYSIDLESGMLSGTHRMYRVSVIGDGEKVDKLDGVSVERGFGNKPEAAINDFIQRNKSSILDKIFDLEVK